MLFFTKFGLSYNKANVVEVSDRPGKVLEKAKSGWLKQVINPGLETIEQLTYEQ